MTIAEQLQPKVSDWAPVGTGRHELTVLVDENRWAVNLSAERVDSLGCLLHEVTLLRSSDAVLSNAQLKARAQVVADQVTGLIEPLRFLEIDELRGEAMLRSDSPTKKSTSLAYYEVVMNAHGRIDLRRFQRADAKNSREQIAFALTHEAIAKVVDDLIR